MRDPDAPNTADQDPTVPPKSGIGGAILVLAAIAALAILNLIEFFVPSLKPFTIPIMGVLILLLALASLFRRAVWWTRLVEWSVASIRGTRDPKDTLESLGPPE